jgi:hypothetical protein
VTSALVVGAPGCGRTTFVGLLYTAIVRFGTEESDRFRFSAERESIRRLEAIYGAIGDGRFPSFDLDREGEPLRFVFGFRRGGLGRLAHAGGTADNEFDTIPVQVGGVPSAELGELLEHESVLDEPTRELLRSSVVLPLINGASLVAPNGDPTASRAGRYDRELVRTLEVLARFLALERNRRRRRLYPIFVLTQFDRLPAETLRALNAPAGPPPSWEAAERAAFGSRLLRMFLPETEKFLSGGTPSKISVAPARWFFSELAIEETPGPETRIRRRSRMPLGGWEPVYPYEEYRALLMELGHRAHAGPVAAAG